MPRKPRPAKQPPPRFFPAGEDADLLDDEDCDQQPLIEFGRRAAPKPKEGTPDAAQTIPVRRQRPT